jgi:hypothetical protein
MLLFIVHNRVSGTVASTTDSSSLSLLTGAIYGPHKQQHQSTGSMHHDDTDTASTLASQAAEAAKKAAQVCEIYILCNISI